MTSKRDAIQTAINRASLRGVQAEDVAKAALAAGLHPKVTEVLMAMHHFQVQLDKDMSEMRSNMIALARVIDQGASVTAYTHAMLEGMATRLSIDPSSLVAAEAPDDGG